MTLDIDKIESAVLAKMNSAEPVAEFWCDDDGVDFGISINTGAVIKNGDALYLHPPAPSD